MVSSSAAVADADMPIGFARRLYVNRRQVGSRPRSDSGSVSEPSDEEKKSQWLMWSANGSRGMKTPAGRDGLLTPNEEGRVECDELAELRDGAVEADAVAEVKEESKLGR